MMMVVALHTNQLMIMKMIMRFCPDWFHYPIYIILEIWQSYNIDCCVLNIWPFIISLFKCTIFTDRNWNIRIALQHAMSNFGIYFSHFIEYMVRNDVMLTYLLPFFVRDTRLWVMRRVSLVLEWSCVGMILCWNDLMLEWSRVGMILCWNDLVLEWSHIGMISCWNDLMLEWSHIGMISCWNDLVLECGMISCWKCDGNLKQLHSKSYD